jgi:NTP pyrophosphatase (non-canonical NTP hydrolase)
MTLDDAFNLVAEYHDANAAHRRTGRRLRMEDSREILRHANEELYELSVANAEYQTANDLITLLGPQLDNSLEELADTLSCLFHFAIKNGFSIDEVSNELKCKLELRFTKD